MPRGPNTAWKEWRKKDRRLSEEEIPYIARLADSSAGWRDPRHEPRKTEAVEEKT